MSDAPKDTCAICGVPEAPGAAFEKGFDDGYKRGMEEAAEIAHSKSEVFEVRTWEGPYEVNPAADIAAAIRAQIQEKDDAPSQIR